MAEVQYPGVSLIVFARAPVPGKCKTRLIPELGEAGAAALQQELIEHTLQQLCTQALCQTQLWCYPDIHHACFESLANKYALSLHRQQGNNLGEKMHHALSQQHSPYSILVGTDIPLLSREYLDQAITVLHEGKDAVIGPAEDGGYVLLGLQQSVASLFEGINWGTATVFAQTCEKMTAAGLSWQAIDTLWDLDDAVNLPRYKRLKSSALEGHNNYS